MLPAVSERELYEQVVLAPRYAYVPIPDMRVIERPGWMQLVTPSFRKGGFNEVSLAVLDEADADATIAATIGEYRRLGLRYRWIVGPDSAPADLAERLAAHGLDRHMSCGMARATAPVDAPAVRVVEVDASTVDAFTQTMAAGWGADADVLARTHDIVLAAQPRTHHMFLAYADGEPAATASYVAFPRSAYLLGGVVLERYRGRGLYRALVAARIEHARARGIELATSLAREETSAPILERLGFETIVRVPVFTG